MFSADKMKRKYWLLFLVFIPLLLNAQSSFNVGSGSSLVIGSGSDLAAGSRSGNISGAGTFNGTLLTTPNVQLSFVTGISGTTATLNGSVNPNGLETEYYFSYGTDPGNLNSSTTAQSVGSSTEDVAVNLDLSSLSNDTFYYFVLNATNSSGTTSTTQSCVLTNSAFSNSNLVLRLRADGGVTSSSDVVSDWKDCGGKLNDASQPNSSYRPTLQSGIINSQPVIRFNGSSSKMTLPPSATLGIQNNPYEMFIVAKSVSSDVQFLIAGGTTEQFEYHLNGVGARFIPITSTYLDLGMAGNYTDGNAHVFSARASSSGGAVRVDGIDGGSSSSNILSSNSSNLLLGVRIDGMFPFNGDIAEVIIYNTVLSTEDRNSVEQYLAGRYNITSGALPVELTSFTAASTGSATAVVLNWTTATEVNNYGFEVERSLVIGNQSLENWEVIGFVEGNGNSNSPKDYSFIDACPFGENPSSGNLQYRLKQIDTDGSYQYYSTIAEVEITITGIEDPATSGLPTEFSLSQNYPNPFNPETRIEYQVAKFEMVSLKVYDVLGNEITTLVNETKAPGKYEIKFDGSELSSGMYLYKLQAGQFVQTRKLLLLK
jgi:hypothetical protein